MDYEESFASAPVRYALDDHDSDEEYQASQDSHKVAIRANLTLSTEGSAKQWTLIFGIEGPGSVFINSLKEKSAAAIGTVTRSVQEKEPEIKANIIQLADQSILLIPFTSEVPGEEAGQYSKAIFNSITGKIQKVVVLDAFTAVGYTSEVWGDDLTPPLLRVLQTSSSAIVKDLPLYESPNMIKGLSASIVNYCEIHSIPCYDLLTLQESIYGKLLVTAEILEAYNQGLHQLGYHLKFNEKQMEDILSARHSGRVDDSHHRLYL